MSKYTETKKNRMLDWTKERGVFKREKPLPAKDRASAGLCYFCKLPVYVSEGQIITKVIHMEGENPTHKACRK